MLRAHSSSVPARQHDDEALLIGAKGRVRHWASVARQERRWEPNAGVALPATATRRRPEARGLRLLPRAWRGGGLPGRSQATLVFRGLCNAISESRFFSCS